MEGLFGVRLDVDLSGSVIGGKQKPNCSLGLVHALVYVWRRLSK
jgi:hypothetical protein